MSVCPQGGGGRAWQGSIHGRGRAWQGEHAWWGGGCACQGDINGDGWGGHAWQGGMRGTHAPPRQILRDTVNERSVRILLECILVIDIFSKTFGFTGKTSRLCAMVRLNQ